MMQAEPSLQWYEPVTEFVGFVSLFLANGAIGFRYAAVRRRLSTGDSPHDAARLLYESAARRAAWLGVIGALVQAVLLATQLPRLAERMHLSTARLLTTDPQTIARCALLCAGLVGFALAAARRWRGWPVAAVGLIGSELSVVLSGRWAGLVNPVHQLLAGLWLGTLAVMVIAGISQVLRGPSNLRGPMVADMVNGFSPLALTCGPLVVVTGVITALMHLHPFASLWSTAYGYALLIKLCLVAIVFALGAWNWRRQRRRLGGEEAAGLILRSSVMELTVATLVLVVTAVLVSLPAPRPPQGSGQAPGVLDAPQAVTWRDGGSRRSTVCSIRWRSARPSAPASSVTAPTRWSSGSTLT
jgi:putative copper export protein